MNQVNYFEFYSNTLFFCCSWIFCFKVLFLKKVNFSSHGVLNICTVNIISILCIYTPYSKNLKGFGSCFAISCKITDRHENTCRMNKKQDSVHSKRF